MENPEILETAKSVLLFIKDYAKDSIFLYLIVIKVIFNVIPTKRSISVFLWLDNIIDHIIPNRSPK